MINEKKAGVVLSYVSIFLSVAISLIYTPFLIRSLGQSQYGLFGLVNTIIAYFTIFDFGFGNAIIKYTAQNRVLGDQKAQETLNGMLLIIYTIIGIIVAILGSALAFSTKAVFKGLSLEENKIMQTLIIIAVFNVGVSFPFTVFKSLITAYEKFVFSRLMDIIMHILNPLTIIIILLLGYKAIGIVIATTVLTIFLNLIRMGYCFIKLKIRFKVPKGREDWKILKEISIYSFFVFLNLIVDRLFWSTGNFILGIVQTSSSIAIFTLAVQIVGFFSLFSTSISSVFLPQISQIATQKDENYLSNLSSIFNRTGRIQFYMVTLVLTGFIVFGRQFINLWVGPNYDESYFVILILIIPFSIPLIQNVGISILQGLNKHKFRSIMYLIVAVINVAISIPLAMRWGAIGAALATSFSLIIGPILLINIYYAKLGLNIGGFWVNILKILPSLIIPIVLGVVFSYIFDLKKILFLIIAIIMYTIIYIISVWFFAMNKYEKELMSSPVKHILQRFKKKREL